jgi:hypothetical protein
MAVWALGRLLEPEVFARCAHEHVAGEPDAAVAKEWRAS